jgi:serine/threonine protein kinase
MLIVFPLNIHDDSAVDQCDKILKLEHKNVIPHIGYFKDELNRLNLIAEYPLLPDLEIRVRSKKFNKKYFGLGDALKILSRIVDGVAYCHQHGVAH